MFSSHYFSGHYFASTYFPEGASVAPPVPTPTVDVVHGGAGWPMMPELEDILQHFPDDDEILLLLSIID